ncbi:hypothetical protein [Agrococcus sp. Ld7]|uniref:hypothetical protein n=1 Tax=Agrococcus sp. Ld7 TaxID=649148 RepID=UPI0038658884
MSASSAIVIRTSASPVADYPFYLRVSPEIADELEDDLARAGILTSRVVELSADQWLSILAIAGPATAGVSVLIAKVSPILVALIERHKTSSVRIENAHGTVAQVDGVHPERAKEIISGMLDQASADTQTNQETWQRMLGNEGRRDAADGDAAKSES